MKRTYLKAGRLHLLTSGEQKAARHHGGFTLIELLVVMGIFVILATISISAFRGTDKDRVSNASATFKNALEGAKSRAVKSNQTRGLRLNLASGSTSEVTSFVYLNGGSVETMTVRVEFNNLPGIDRWMLAGYGEANDILIQYVSKGLITSGTEVEIPAYSNNWLKFQRFDENPTLPLTSQTFAGADVWWPLSGAITGATAAEAGPPENGLGRRYSPAPEEELDAGSIGLPSALASQQLQVRVKLQPSILTGSEPITLPVNTCVDLVASKIPSNWRPQVAGDRFGPNRGGYMDILFTPQGTLARPLSVEGILHFVIASQVDLQKSAARTANDDPTFVLDLESGAKLVSVVTQTGMLINADLNISNNLTDPSPEPNDFVGALSGLTGINNPYYYAIFGKESK
ncbi:pilus assembly FimT family protein [Planctomicrobium sp. SH668]|uniref:pilus assembly FimT family protein n=1 Tax=Planctomicrobium sp. SH668 TaxID=3448126 RepID=UPI003F5C75DE